MPVQVQFSNCGKPEVEIDVHRRAVEIFRNVPEDWTVSVVPEGEGNWSMIIVGPSHFRYDLDLRQDAGEHDPEFIITAIKQAIIGETSG